MHLLAVHIADGVLDAPWAVGGFTGAALLVLPGLVRVAERDVPRIALLTAAFFIGSSIHVPLPPTSVHLLLNALVGAVLGRRAGLAIFVGLLFQWAFLGHGGLSALGVNTCVLTFPALVAATLLDTLYHWELCRRPLARAALAFTSALLVLQALALSVEVLVRNRAGIATTNGSWGFLALHPAVVAAVAALGLAAAVWERRLESRPYFVQGCLVGVATVLATVGLQALVLRWGVSEMTDEPVAVIVLAHLPVAALEGLIVGFAVAFLRQVRPDLLGRRSACRQGGEQLVE